MVTAEASLGHDMAHVEAVHQAGGPSAAPLRDAVPAEELQLRSPKPSPADEATVNEMLQRAITSPEPTGRYVARVLHGAHAGAVDASISVPAARPAAARTVLDETAMCSPYIVQGPSFCQRLVHFVDRRHLYCTYMRTCSGMRPNGCPVSIPRQLVVNQSTVAHGHLPDPMSGLLRSAPPLSLSP
ncbi:hypothetical protein ACCO45_007184 [Purpureocillium lilacinum]|uniref:Uncharacterized protein n=1 Tax=Purpureocillium lilacinum TaxID=33203 RepID=A0ACC4DSH1_PURLI